MLNKQAGTDGDGQGHRKRYLTLPKKIERWRESSKWIHLRRAGLQPPLHDT